MRKLTKPEIDAAPGWAKSYSIQAQNDTPIFYAGEGGGAQPIPRKEFDIMDYDFDDPILSVSESSKEAISFHCYTREKVTLSREDWIAGAKHFKLTASDLS